MHNLLYVVLFVLIIIFCSGFSVSSDIDIVVIQKKLAETLPRGVVYTKVPRGLIVSMDENILFNSCNSKIKEEALYILDDIAEVLKGLSNFCVIENHIQKTCIDGLENWELSMMRSANITEYLIKFKNVSQEQLFDIGYGQFMPFRENVNPQIDGLNNRIDFVIINYEAKR